MKSYAIANVEGPLAQVPALVERVGLLSATGVDFIQLRAKRLDARALYELARKCRAVIDPPTAFLVNGRVDVALAAGADGVHLPSNGLPPRDTRVLVRDLVVGVSCHTVEECRVAAAAGVDYLLFGPLYPARSKSSEARVSEGELREVVKLPVEVFALGGITVDRVHDVAAAGAAGVAAITMFMIDEPIGEIVERVRRA